MKIEVLSLEDTRWTDWLSSFRHVNPFSQPAYGHAIANASRSILKPKAVVITSRDDILGGAMIFEKNRFGLTRWVVPPLTPYTPFLFNPENTDTKSHRELLDFWIRSATNDLHALTTSFQPEIPTEKIPEIAGFMVQQRKTYWANTRTESDLLAGWPKKRRYAYRKAAEKLVFEVSTDMKVAAQRIEQSYFRQGSKSPIPNSGMVTLLETLSNQLLVHLYLAHADTENVAALVVLREGSRSFYWLAGSKPGDNLLFLTVKAIDDLYAKGCEEIDFVGANIPGVAAFKRKFDPELRTYSVGSWTRPGIVRLLHSAGILK